MKKIPLYVPVRYLDYLRFRNPEGLSFGEQFYVDEFRGRYELDMPTDRAEGVFTWYADTNDVDGRSGQNCITIWGVDLHEQAPGPVPSSSGQGVRKPIPGAQRANAERSGEGSQYAEDQGE